MSRYDIEKFDPPPDPDLVCCICQCVLDKAVECPCRHVFCQGCIERWLTNRHTCPTCRKRTRKQDLKPVLPLVQNMLNRLLMICEYRDSGCLEKVMLEHFERHVKNCGYEMKTCRFSKCGVRILRMHLDDHENDQCEHRETACEGECGLMIPLSDRPSHNCVAALKAHIDEKNRMIEQLKVKLHELNNLSQSLNDQLVELRQQLNDRNHIFSSDSSDSSESDVTDFMSDDLSRDSFRSSWFDSPSSNISADNMDNASNNDTNQDNNNNPGHAEGSDVVEQVERTVVNSLFELSSRLERVRNQMRAVLNSRLVQDQNNLSDDVRIPSAAELDAIVNSNNNDSNNAATVTAASDTANNENNNSNNDEGHSNESGHSRDNDNSDNELNETRYFTEDENHSTDRYSYANDSQWSNLTEDNCPANPAGSDVSDLNWISDSDSNHTPYNRSPNPQEHSPDYERYTPFRNENRNYNDQYVSEHVILSQPPDSPSDTTGSFSSIPSTSSVANSPTREHDNEDSMHGSSLTATPTTNNHSSPEHSERSYLNTTDNNSRSPVSLSPRSPDSCRNHDSSDHHTIVSSPAHSVSSLASASGRHSSKSEATHYSSDEDYCSSVNRDSHNDDKSDTSAKCSPISHCSDYIDSEPDDIRNVETTHNESKEEKKSSETSYVDSSLDYEHGESNEESPNGDHLSETSAESQSHHEDQEESDSGEDHHKSNTKTVQGSHVSRCEPDSTQSPSTIDHFSTGEGLSANNPLMISPATESSESDNSESMKYLTKRVRRSDRSEEKKCSSGYNASERNTLFDESTDPGSTVDSGFITGTNSPTNGVCQPSSNSKKYSSRKRKYASNSHESDEYKKGKSNGEPPHNYSDQTCQPCTMRETHTLSDTLPNNSSNMNRYGFRKRTHDNDLSLGIDCKKSKASGVASHHGNGQTNTYHSRTSPPRNRQSWREASQHMRRNRTNVNRRNNQSSVNNDNSGQSLNVKIDLSLINYSGHLVSESTSTTIPTATVVHSANISPIPTDSLAKREPGITSSRQNISDNGTKSSTPKQDDTTAYRNNHRQRTSRAQRHESLCSTRNTNINSSPARATTNVTNTCNRDFPNSWRDSSDSSSDNTWEPGSDCDEMDDSITEGEDGFETESSYEVQIPKSTAALLEEYASDESDESWTVGMH